LTAGSISRMRPITVAKRNPPQTGSTSANFHEASRSEYLAHFVFSSLGTSIPVPRPEDTGLDLYCTLTRRVGQRIWPQGYYSVQVKSNMDSWTFEGHDSVRWLIEHPLPLFLCVVLKKEALVRVYQTSPRFYPWSLGLLPQRVELIPGEGRQGVAAEWIDGTKFSLSAPILEASIAETLADEFVGKAKEVLQFWIDTDMENLARLRSGVRSFKVPHPYTTGERTVRGWMAHGVNRADRETVNAGIARLREPLDWVTDQLFKQGDLPGAIRGMLLLRHLYWGDRHSPASLANGSEIRDLLGKEGAGWVNQVVDEVGCQMDSGLLKDLRDPNRLTAVKRLYLGGACLGESDFERISHATELRYLFLADTRLADRALRYLTPLANLRELHLEGNPITGRGLVHLNGLVQLEILGLSNTKVSDRGLRHLVGLSRLENLYLNRTRVTSKCVSRLRILPRLELLTLNDTSIDDAALSELADCDSLRRLDVTGTKVTASGVEAFNRARSNVAVIR
jgi:Leucine Rich repeat